MLTDLKERMIKKMKDLGVKRGSKDQLQQINDVALATNELIEQPWDGLYHEKMNIILDYIEGCENQNDLVESTQENEDKINSPKHYNNGALGIETIDMIQNAVPDFGSYLLGNVFKYVSRYQYKNGLEDLKKAQWYLNKLIDDKNAQGIAKHRKDEKSPPEANAEGSGTTNETGDDLIDRAAKVFYENLEKERAIK